ncbi:PAS domain-containing protein [Phenylobacterium sp.]|uniref:PAS domain-containing protein n=1 Tax=Phenylobacterium sp. TaxID=1871053 RepID=UPI0025FF995F|nr:PAS domain-containing protein [Phenylobacterium sp.]MBX3483473.1 PAS domain-containing protein [Phenylobacterium sp.]MCW5758928.1 PAS domain-containing protein [Phenylobacterium sp.]
MPEHIFSGLSPADADAPGHIPMAEATRQFDWASTSAGAIEQWPDPLKYAVRLMLLSPAPMAVFIGREGLLAHNDAARDLFGMYYAGSLGRPVEEVFPQAAALCREGIDRCFAGLGRSFRDESFQVCRNGEWNPAWFHLACTPIADVDGNVAGVFLVISETTERVMALRDLRRSQERIEIALDAGGIVGTWDLDLATNRLTCDGRFARLFGMSAQDGRASIDNDLFAHLVHPDDRARWRNVLAQAARTGADYKCRYRIVTSDGATHWYLDAGRAVRDEKGAVVKLCGVVVDLTSQIAAEDALADSERRFRGLVESVPQIVWSTDVHGRHDYFNSRWNEFTGVDVSDMDETTWEVLVHPDDWRRVSEDWSGCVATGRPYDIEYRFLHHSGRYRWLRVMALPVRDADGAITRWYGTATDIEENKTLEMERELVANELEHRIRNLFALVNGLVVLSGREDAAFGPFADQLRHRLSALHTAHEFIRSRDTVPDGTRSLQSLARAILAPYEGGRGIVVQGDDALLQEHLVTPLTLVFHELATNSAKYGALACEGGLLSLRFRCAGGRIMLSWSEEGVSASRPAAGNGGFGSKLLTLTIERQLKGTFSRALTPAGLTFEMEIPA